MAGQDGLPGNGDDMSQEQAAAYCLSTGLKNVPDAVIMVNMANLLPVNAYQFNFDLDPAIVAAAAGVKIAKHGNKSISSKSGSADLLEYSGINIDLDEEQAKKCFDDHGITFMFAPKYHKAMKSVSTVRKNIKTRTIFNVLGPLSNPANANFQILGVYDKDLILPIAKVLKDIGIQRALVVHSEDGLDEISTTDATIYTELKPNGEIRTGILSSLEFGFSLTGLESLKGGDPDENAEIIRNIFNGEKGPCRDIVVINAAAGIMVGGKAETLSDGIRLAEASIDTGATNNVLESLSAVK